ncbi:glycosyltransferase family 4 protein [Geosporobacter ferrireducens]|uniref:glycosyltransferase family 4 protein n=1 Tax=Geosporobacter ferrireducens TaxID=1424294 RepID=UPI00139F23FE|nr:glycosyltransferase family 4 protein [Geosporobacter ferrireducens]MTI53320.1 glycosyltransferase family 4 protein [Geosporobacter ferrireducens]
MVRKVYQLMDALDYGDAVSNHAINLNTNLLDMGYETKIFSIYVHDKVKDLYNSYKHLYVSKNDVVLFHFSGKTKLLEFVKSLPCKKILVYHNVTPPEFFADNPNLFNHCNEGLDQLNEIKDIFDLFIADSDYNLSDLKKMGVKKIEILPIFIDFDKIKSLDRNKNLLAKYEDSTIFLFVGRVAPNKKHEDIIQIFSYYYSHIDSNSKLIFVGNYEDYMDYYQKLNSMISLLPSRDNIVFTGKVDNRDLTTYYSLGDIFICMSEHEGFCVPLLESMAFEIPTIAYNAGAVGTTMGLAGILINEKEHEKIAELINIILENEEIRKKIVEKQKIWIEKFDMTKLRTKVKNILDSL